MLRDAIIVTALERQVRVKVPVLNRMLRLPNRRWKVKAWILNERLVITGLNVIRLRRLCYLAFGYEPVVEGFDPKPMDFNESGSQQRKTLSWKGSVTRYH